MSWWEWEREGERNRDTHLLVLSTYTGCCLCSSTSRDVACMYYKQSLHGVYFLDLCIYGVVQARKLDESLLHACHRTELTSLSGWGARLPACTKHALSTRKVVAAAAAKASEVIELRSRSTAGWMTLYFLAASYFRRSFGIKKNGLPKLFKKCFVVNRKVFLTWLKTFQTILFSICREFQTVRAKFCLQVARESKNTHLIMSMFEDPHSNCIYERIQ